MIGKKDGPWKTFAMQHGVFIETDDGQLHYMMDPRLQLGAKQTAEKIQAAADAICETINDLPHTWRVNAIQQMIAEVALQLDARDDESV
jgi:hypothetical protein